jgi:hypothetical protein
MMGLFVSIKMDLPRRRWHLLISILQNRIPSKFYISSLEDFKSGIKHNYNIGPQVNYA